MPVYRWGGLTIASDFELPELPLADGGEDDVAPWRVTSRVGRAPSRPGRRWFHRWTRANGRPWAALARDSSGHLLRFTEIGDFDVSVAARTIACYPHDDAPAHTVRHLLLDQVLPLVIGDRNHLSLHGSVVAAPEGALVFLGSSGHGKSSLAAHLARRGCPIVSDDCCVVELSGAGLTVVPTYPGLRLRPDAIAGALGPRVEAGEPVAHYTTKQRLADRQGLPYAGHAVPLARVYVIAARTELEQSRRVAITPRSGSQALLDLTEFTFHLDVGDPARVRDAFTMAGEVAATCPVRHLSFAWNLAAAGQVAEAVLSDG